MSAYSLAIGMLYVLAIIAGTGLAVVLFGGCMPSPQDFERDPPAWICTDEDDAGVLECIEVVEV